MSLAFQSKSFNQQFENTTDVGHSGHITGSKSLAETVSRSVFFLYILFLLFGGQRPFQDAVTNVNDIKTSNFVNQVVDSLLPFASFLCLLPRRKQLFLLLKKEKFLSLFVLWSLCSMLWSDFPVESFKHWIRMLGSIIVCLGFLLNVESPDEALKYFQFAFAFYVPLSFIAIALVPAATQWEFPAWRGLASHKNTLGQISLVSTIIALMAIGHQPGIKRRIYPRLFLFASIVLLIGANSTTSRLCSLFLLATASWLYVDKHLQTLRVGRLISLTMICFLLLLFFLLRALEFTELESITAVFGKESNFSGRTDLWEAILEEAKTHLFWGCGFDGFWITRNPTVLSLYQDERFVWLPNEAHQGYLDILNETGIVGLSLLMLMIVFYFRKLSQLGKPHMWKWFFLCTLFLNWQESTLFRTASLTGWIFLFSYLALYWEFIREGSHYSQKILLQ